MTQKKRRVSKKKSKKVASMEAVKAPPTVKAVDGIIWSGNPELKKWLVPIDDVKPNPENARKHAEKDINATALSINGHGQQWPVMVKPDLMLMAGEGRWLAMRKLGWTHVSALVSNINDEGERSLFSVRDNRTAELSFWDVTELGDHLKTLSEHFKLDQMGLWEDYELQPMLGIGPPEAEDVKTGSKIDTGPEMGAPILLTVDQRKVVDRAVAAVRGHDGLSESSEGRAIELICGDFLAGPNPE